MPSALAQWVWPCAEWTAVVSASPIADSGCFSRICNQGAVQAAISGPRKYILSAPTLGSTENVG